jgi:flagellar hook-associated protein 2
MTQSQVVTKINQYSTQTGVTASASNSYLTLRRNSHGSSVHITAQSSVSANLNAGANSGIGSSAVTDENAAGELGTGLGAAGLDVQGTINGEAATGSGQYLTGNTGNANTEGLKIRIAGSTTGNLGTVVFTRGLAGVIADYADNATAIGTGTVASAKTNLEELMDDIDDDIDRLQARLASQEERLYRQFSAMEDAMNKLQSQGQYLAAQLRGM